MDGLSRRFRQTVLYGAEVLPAGFLLGSGLAFSVPQDHTTEIVTIVILIMSGAMSALAYKAVLQAVNFGIVAALLALCCIAHRILSHAHAPKLTAETTFMDEIFSCLREYAIMTACVGFAVVMGSRSPTRRAPVDSIPVERPNPFGSITSSLLHSLDLGSKRPQENSSNSDKLELVSDPGSLFFRHVGPASSYSGTSEHSVLSLSSSSGRVDPALAMVIWQLSMKVTEVKPTRDEDASTVPQVEVE